MNKRNLALLISKHPLLRKLTEDKTIPNSVVARLIVEELIKEDISTFNQYQQQIESAENKEEFVQFAKTLELVSTGGGEGQMTEEEKNGILKILRDKLDHLEQSSAGDEKYKKFVNTYTEEMSTFSDDEKQALYLFTVELDKNIPKNLNEDVFTTLTQGFVNLVSNEQDALLKKSIVALDEQTQQVLVGIVKDVDKNLVALKIIRHALNLEIPQAQADTGSEDTGEPSEPSGEPSVEPSGEPETDEAGENEDPPPSEIPEDKKNEYIDASTKFQNEFYNQKYRIQQAKLIGSVIDAIEKIYDNPNKVAAFARPPQEQESVKEQQETVEPSKDELRNLRVDFRSFLSRVNKTSKALEKFEKIKDSGSMITDTYKKQFIDLLKEVQMSIKRIHRDLQVIIGKRQINEIDENSDIMKKWKEVETKYNKAVASASALRELIDGDSTSEDPEQIIQDTYASLSDLATHFPSINPFASSGAKTREDMNKYKNSFENAVKQVKSDLQNVLALINQGQSGEDTLQLAMEGLKTFSGAIQNTFGIESQFKDIKVEKDTPAAEGETIEVAEDEPELEDGEGSPEEEDTESQTTDSSNSKRTNDIFDQFFALNTNIFDEKETDFIKQLIQAIDKEIYKNPTKYLGRTFEEIKKSYRENSIKEGLFDAINPFHKKLNKKVFDATYTKPVQNTVLDGTMHQWFKEIKSNLFKNALKNIPKDTQEGIITILKDNDKGEGLVTKIQAYIIGMIKLAVGKADKEILSIHFPHLQNVTDKEIIDLAVNSSNDEEEEEGEALDWNVIDDGAGSGLKKKDEQIANKLKPLIREMLNKGK
jgi:hypothetical protein